MAMGSIPIIYRLLFSFFLLEKWLRGLRRKLAKFLYLKKNTAGSNPAFSVIYMNSLFALFSAGAWVSAVLVLNSKNPVHAVFYLVLVFLHASGLLCLLGLEYFALLQLLVYIGALAIMFLFVVMLLEIPVTEIVAYQRGTYPVAGILACCLLVSIWFVLWQPYWEVSWAFLQNSLFSRNIEDLTSGEIVKNQISLVSPLLPNDLWTNYSVSYSWDSLAITFTPIAQLGVALYAVHIDLLILASFVLLVAMIGAVALTLKRRVSAPVHDVFAQHNRDFQKVVLEIQKSFFDYFDFLIFVFEKKKLFILNFF